MTRKTASDFHPEVLKLFDQYVHGIIPRRGFLKSAARFAIGAVTAEALLDALNPRFAEAAARLAWQCTVAFFTTHLRT